MIKNKLNLVKKIFNRFTWGNKNLLFLSLGKSLKPKWIWFEVTDRCNSRCSHCHIWQKKPTQNPLTLEEMEKTFRDPLFDEVEIIINSGGEAILRDDLEEIIRMEHKIFPKAHLDLSTNGILPDRALKIVHSLLKDDIKLNVGISLEAIGKKHDETRGSPGNFEKVDYLLHKLIELRKLYKNNLSMVIGFTLSNLTIQNWKEAKEYAEKLDIDFMVQWYNQSSFYNNNGDKLNDKNLKMEEVVKKLPNTIIREKWLRWLKNKPIKFNCFTANTFFALKCGGDIVPCLNFWDLSLGNVREKTPTEIWHSSKAKEIRQVIKKCPGCLNSWGVEWSISSSFYPRLLFYLRHPSAIKERFNRKN